MALRISDSNTGCVCYNGPMHTGGTLRRRKAVANACYAWQQPRHAMAAGVLHWTVWEPRLATQMKA